MNEDKVNYFYIFGIIFIFIKVIMCFLLILKYSEIYNEVLFLNEFRYEYLGFLNDMEYHLKKKTLIYQ